MHLGFPTAIITMTAIFQFYLYTAGAKRGRKRKAGNDDTIEQITQTAATAKKQVEYDWSDDSLLH